MQFDKKTLAKILSPRILERVITTVDSSIATLVLSFWAAAITLVIIALYTVNMSVSAKKEAEIAAVGEPSLPIIVNRPLTTEQLLPLISRLQRQFPEINFSQSSGALTISTNDGSKFRLWLTVLSYVDTISPEYRWILQDFCVGMKCPNAAVMYAMVKADSISFTSPPKQ